MHINNPFSSVSSDPLERAKSLLVHYFQVATNNRLSRDSVNEIALIVDSILEAVEVNKPENRIKQLEKEVRLLVESDEAHDYHLKKILDKLNKLENLEGKNSEIVEGLKAELSDYFAD